MAAAALVAATGGANAIVGGVALSSPRANPGAVVLAAPGYTVSCTAARIAPRWVLTARHCADLKPDRVFTDTLVPGSGAVADVVRTVLAPEGDMALLELEQMPPGPVLPYAVDAPTRGAAARIYGWGMTSAGSEMSDTLKSADARVDAHETNPFYGGRDVVLRGDTGAPWKGDSGGPALIDGVLVGVLSWSDSYGDNPNGRAGYASTAAHAAWIEQTTGAAGTRRAVFQTSADVPADAWRHVPFTAGWWWPPTDRPATP